jgi:hypothetical protein
VKSPRATRLLKSRTYGDAAKTTAAYSYNTNRWLTRSVVSRTGATPEVLLDNSYGGYDTMGNATQLTDNRNYKEWPIGAQPVSRSLSYDDLYRLRSVAYKYAHDDTQESIYTPSDLSPIPLPTPATRVQKQSYDYDWQHNLVASHDDLNDLSSFFTRSVGTETYGSATSGPNQVRSVSGSGGNATIGYDPAGNLTSFKEPYAITLSGSPVPSFQLAYTWDEVGRISTATRSDYDGTSYSGGTTVS